MVSDSSNESDEKVTSVKGDLSSTSLIDESLPARYAETMKNHSRLNPGNEPSMSSRVLLLGFVGFLFYYALRTKLDVRLMRAKMDFVDYDQDFTGINLEEA